MMRPGCSAESAGLLRVWAQVPGRGDDKRPMQEGLWVAKKQALAVLFSLVNDHTPQTYQPKSDVWGPLGWVLCWQVCLGWPEEWVTVALLGKSLAIQECGICLVCLLGGGGSWRLEKRG